MKSPIRTSLLLASTLSILVGCKAKSPDLTSPVPAAANYTPLDITSKGLTPAHDAQVDILFVIDDSDSMKNHQENLSRNIQKFVDAFAKVKSIDFHIAFTNVYDRTRYGTIVPEVCGPNTTTPGRVNWQPAGTLNPLIGPKGKLPTDGRRYLTRDDDVRGILRESLDPNKNPILLKHFINPDPKHPEICPYGPEEEELFTPLLGALEDPTLVGTSAKHGPNWGFRRDGAFFVGILVSDAKDASGLTPEQVVYRLKQDTKSADSSAARFRIFSVAIKPGTRLEPSCKPDPAFEQATKTRKGRRIMSYPWGHVVTNDDSPLAELAELTASHSSVRDQVLSICSSDYGDELAKYGTQIQQDALRDIVLQAPYYAQVTSDPSQSLRVYLGNVELQPGVQWKYNPMNPPTITIFGDQVDWNADPDAKIRVIYTPVDQTHSTAKLVPGEN